MQSEKNVRLLSYKTIAFSEGKCYIKINVTINSYPVHRKVMVIHMNLSISHNTPYGYSPVSTSVDPKSAVDGEKKLPIDEEKQKKANGQMECETCKKRKYQDGSDEMVSFKTASHISPESAATRVRAHEQEHVRNAYAKEATGEAKVLSASVSIQTSICPECGRTYVSGGLTTTKLKYTDEENPYQKDRMAQDHDKYAGMNASYAV